MIRLNPQKLQNIERRLCVSSSNINKCAFQFPTLTSALPVRCSSTAHRAKFAHEKARCMQQAQLNRGAPPVVTAATNAITCRPRHTQYRSVNILNIMHKEDKKQNSPKVWRAKQRLS